tara:strand:+ start:278 stop:493 length:216 start_codon:yes stop_codon:yes gene_type:complete
MAFIGFVINVLALSVGGSHPVTITSLIASFWAWGIATNFRAHPHDIPNYVVWLNIGSLIVGIVMLVVGVTS